MFKKIMSTMLIVAITAGIAIGGTVAWFTDRESTANVFTVGNVEIELKEDFEQGKTLLPGVDIEKKPTITNTGKSDAWVWASIAFPAAFDRDNASENVVHFNYSKESVADGLWSWQDGTDWRMEKDVEINGVKYNVYNVLYQTALKPGETTAYPVMTKVYMDTNVDIDPEGNWYIVEKGVATALGYNSQDVGDPKIYVSAYAIQKNEFDTVQDAYAAYTAQWTTDEGVNNGLEWGKPAQVVTGGDELKEALGKDEDVIMGEDIEMPAEESNSYGVTGISVKAGQLIDGGNNVLSVKDANGTWDTAINAYGGTVKNVTVTDAFRGLFINHSTDHPEWCGHVVVENVKIDGTTYTISCDQGTNNGLTAIDSTFNGWTSYAATLGDAKFVDCYFGEGRGYSFCRPYAPTEFVGCEFEAGYKMDPIAAVTFENCTIGGVALTAENLSTLVTSNIANATVK